MTFASWYRNVKSLLLFNFYKQFSDPALSIRNKRLYTGTQLFLRHGLLIHYANEFRAFVIEYSKYE